MIRKIIVFLMRFFSKYMNFLFKSFKSFGSGVEMLSMRLYFGSGVEMLLGSDVEIFSMRLCWDYVLRFWMHFSRIFQISVKVKGRFSVFIHFFR